jgi:DNA-binding transcriptional ArsR family regulator
MVNQGRELHAVFRALAHGARRQMLRKLARRELTVGRARAAAAYDVAGRRLEANTFTGIAPSNAPAFIASQLCGALLELMLAKWLQIDTASIPRVDEAQIKA